MSCVTSIIILGPWSERGVPTARQPINLINKYFENQTKWKEDENIEGHQHDGSPFVDVSPYTGGTKGMSGAIFTKGCNYLDLNHFLDWLVQQKIYYPEQYNLLINREYANDIGYHHIKLDKLFAEREWKDVDWVMGKINYEM